MTQEQKAQVIEQITGIMNTEPFTFEFHVKKKPEGLKIIYEVSQDGCLVGQPKKKRQAQ